MRIIAESTDSFRVVCEACGAHRIVDKQLLPPMLLCPTCDVLRLLLERRRHDYGHVPERRKRVSEV